MATDLFSPAAHAERGRFWLSPEAAAVDREILSSDETRRATVVPLPPDAERPLHPSRCGPCGDCVEALADYATIPAYASRLSPRDEVAAAKTACWRKLEFVNEKGERRLIGPPKPDKLARHVKLYGDEGVAEVINAFAGKDTSLPLSSHRTKVSPRRRTTAQMRQVVATYGQTHPVSAIANTLNISERRVKEILAESA